MNCRVSGVVGHGEERADVAARHAGGDEQVARAIL
jgi:hypothetical protein